MSQHQVFYLRVYIDGFYQVKILSLVFWEFVTHKHVLSSIKCSVSIEINMFPPCFILIWLITLIDFFLLNQTWNKPIPFSHNILCFLYFSFDSLRNLGPEIPCEIWF